MDPGAACGPFRPDLLQSLHVTTFQCQALSTTQMTLANHVFLEIDGYGFHAFATNFLFSPA